MLNPAFPSKFIGIDTDSYILPENIMKLVVNKNLNFDTGHEYRLQKVYEYEIWSKLAGIGLNSYQWSDKRVLDVCCGKGFLSYHLLARVKPLELVMTDISPKELKEAKSLIYTHYPDINAKYLACDILNSDIPTESYDVIIGNSYLHHFYNLPLAFREIMRMLNPGGLFITLHEPTIAAVAYEGGSFQLLLSYIRKGPSYIDDIRSHGDKIAPDGGTDVWIFRKEKIAKLLNDAGYENIIFKDWHLFRALMVAKFSLHLGKDKPYHSRREEFLLKLSMQADTILKNFLPSTMFGSLCFAAKKPNRNEVTND